MLAILKFSQFFDFGEIWQHCGLKRSFVKIRQNNTNLNNLKLMGIFLDT